MHLQHQHHQVRSISSVQWNPDFSDLPDSLRLKSSASVLPLYEDHTYRKDSLIKPHLFPIHLRSKS